MSLLYPIAMSALFITLHHKGISGFYQNKGTKSISSAINSALILSSPPYTLLSVMLSSCLPILSFDTAISILYPLVLVCLIPGLARSSFNSRRAIKVFDFQQCTKEPPPTPLNQSLTFGEKVGLSLLIFFVISSPLTSSAFVAGSMEYYGLIEPLPWPNTGLMMPILILTAMLYALLESVYGRILGTKSFASRDLNTGWCVYEMQYDYCATRSRLAKVLYAYKRNTVSIGIFIISLTLSITAHWIGRQMPTYMAFICGAFFLLVWLKETPNWMAPSSFIGLIIPPLLLLCLVVVMALPTGTFVYVMKQLANLHHWIFNLEPSSINLANVDYSMPTISLLWAFISSFAVFPPIWIIFTAYYYDLMQAGLTTVTPDEVASIMQMNQSSPMDPYGRQLIQRSAASMPRNRLPDSKFRTYRVAFSTFITCLFMGVYTKEDFSIYTTNVKVDSTSSLSDSFITSNIVWTLVAYPCMCLVMMASACLQPDRTLKSLLLHQEDSLIANLCTLAAKWPTFDCLGEKESGETGAEKTASSEDAGEKQWVRINVP
jgi:hypothetical protein